MKIDLFNSKEFIDINKLKQVTSPVLFQRGDIPHPEGLVSNQIFGVTVKSRKSTFAYIDLQGHFFHPHIYKAIKRMFRNMEKIINGEQAYTINDEGILVLDNEKGYTGIEFIYDNWEKINWEKSDSFGMRNERVDLLRNFKKDEIFTHYLIVIPPFYRDVKSTNSGSETGDLNRYYSNAIRYASMIREKDMFDFQFNQTNMNVQNLLVDVYDFFKTKLEKKTGMLRRYLLGKNVDFCTRTVITAPSYHASRPDDLLVDFKHAALPIAQVCSLANPFIVRWVKEFFEREMFSNSEDFLVYDPIKDDGVNVRLDRPEAIYTDKWIAKMIDTFIRDPESRFNKIEVPVKDSKQKYFLQFTGRRFDTTNTTEISGLSYRALTWTDILYQACVDVTNDKHCMITRYPLLDEFGIFIAAIHISSTTKTMPVMLGGKIYKWYPVIEFDTPEEKMATKFVDSVQFSNSYLPGLDGDYDGDQTTVKIIFTQEANEECVRVMNSKSYFINASGKFIRAIELEAVQTFYVMTKNPSEGAQRKTVSDEDTKKFIEMKPEEYTFEFLIDLLGNLADEKSSSKVKHTVSKYSTTDTMNIKNDYLGFKGTTTLGRFIFNKMIVEYCNMQNVLGFINEPITDGVHSKNEKIIANALKNDDISVANIYRYIDTRDWLGLQLHAVICTSFTPNTIKKPKEVEELHQQLLKKYKKELDANDPKASEIIEKALIEKSKEILKDDVGMDLYLSGARGSINNNFKNIYLTRGAAPNIQTGGYDIIKGSLMDGLDKKDMAAHANTILVGGYSKSCEPAISGYLAKELCSSLQTEVLGPVGSDCGTTKTLDVIIPPKIEDYLYRYIYEGKDLICLTPEVIKKYIGKHVKMRSPMYCIDPKCICNKCAGEDFYKLGKQSIGLSATKVATTCTRLNMKKFHENLIKTRPIDLNDIFL